MTERELPIIRTIGCGRCHTCGTRLETAGWCPDCHELRHYRSHGWETGKEVSCPVVFQIMRWRETREEVERQGRLVE